MFSHIHIGTNDFEAAFSFYSEFMAELGLSLKFHEVENGWAGWMKPGQPRPLFLLGGAYDGRPASPGNGQMTAFAASSRVMVGRCYALAITNGAACEGPPGPRPHYHADYYGAYFRDLDGNKLCVVCHSSEES